MNTFLIPPRQFVRLPGGAGPSVRCVRDARLKPEGYRLTATATGVEIAAADAAGEFYGHQTLRELRTLHNGAIPACRILDWPDFSRRGVYLDCARGKAPTLATLKALVERLAAWKINEFQMYIKNGFAWKKHPELGRGFSPYTPDELRAIDAHCRAFHIRFVPSLASFSHSELMLALPRYRHLAELPGALGWPGGTTLCMTDPKSVELIGELYREFLPCFTADEVNVCCDEPWELGQGRSKSRVDRIGKGRVYREALLNLRRICDHHGKRMNAWGDIVLQHPELLKEMPRDIVLLNWDYDPNGQRVQRSGEFADAGIPYMVCPGTGSWQSHGSRMTASMANVSQFAAVGRRNGAIGLLNTDWGDFGHRNFLGVSLHGYAHGAAHAWNGAAVDEKTFTRAFTLHTFGDTRGQWAAALRQLGTTDTASNLYHALVEPLELPATRYILRFDPPSIVSHYPAWFPECISKFKDSAPAVRWPAEPRGLPDFERHALREYRLASHMNDLAIRRAFIGQAVRAGRHTSPAVLRRWADDMQALATAFTGQWLARNRPTRLRDNLRLMAFAEKECRQRLRQ